MIRVDVYVPDPAGLLATGAFGAGAVIRIERATSQAGSFAEVTTLPLVATTVAYSFWDPSGVATSWYRWRVSNSGNTTDSPYSDSFEGTSPAASVLPSSYAQVQDVLKLFTTKPSTPDRLARLADLVGLATDQLIEQCGHRDYFRHPSSGSTTWVADGNGTATLHVHEGLVALDLLELSFDGGLTYVNVDAGDYMLRGDSPYSAEPVPSGEPYFHVVFSGFPAATSVGGYTTFPPTVRSARLTGARGWPSVPRVLVEATAQRARQLAASEATYSGSSAGGPDEYGHVSTTDRFWPQSVWNFLQAEHDRFLYCRVGRR